MTSTDLIIVTVYLICIYYVILQAWNSLEERTVIKHVGNVFDYETLKDFLDVKFKLDDFYAFSKQPAKLAATIQNKSPSATITVDWEKGALRDFQGNDRRLLHLVPGLQEAAKAQTPSTISPKRSFSATLTAEGLVTADDETKELRATKPIVDVEKLAQDKNAKPKDKKDEEKIQKLKTTYSNFMAMREPLTFSLRLPLQITNIVEGSKKDMWGFVDCNFTVSRKPRIDQLPWNPKPPKK
ncbi:MAG: hypothetical protein HC827_07945 [Cyanobacteria bacterium RM1_2_2]|nr:hypothetical protein [Cyanobacteria bacterium RM1_2_2]